MSRSNPNAELSNPSTKWFEWDGENGVVRYYDKNVTDNQGKVNLTLPFTFLVLDQLSVIKGWHEQSKSGIISNEVRSIKDDVLTVRAFKGPELAKGLYSEIKDTVGNKGGQFHASIYIAYKEGGEFKIANLSLKGAGVNAWIEFVKANRSAINDKAVTITGFTEDKKGKIVFRIPTFEVKDITSSTQEVAVELDKELQAYLNVYLISKKIVEKVENQKHHEENFTELDNQFAESALAEKESAHTFSKEVIDDLPF